MKGIYGICSRISHTIRKKLQNYKKISIENHNNFLALKHKKTIFAA